MEPVKPKKKSFKSVYRYNDIIDYIEKKHNIETRGYKRELDNKYRDFWHWLLDHSNIKNGTFAYFPEDWDDEYSPWWVKEIMTLIVKEFYPNENDELEFWVEW